jgi:hypothetical protein
MPEPAPFGETLFEARTLAMTGALFVKRPGGGCVESVLTRATHLLLVACLRFFSLADTCLIRSWTILT